MTRPAAITVTLMLLTVVPAPAQPPTPAAPAFLELKIEPDADGKLPDPAHLRFHLDDRDRFGQGLTLRPSSHGPGGRYTLKLVDRFVALRPTVTVMEWVNGRPTRMLRLPAPNIDAGTHDLGSGPLEPLPLVVSGVVSDGATGRPLAGVEVEWAERPRRGSWTTVYQLRSRTDAKGRFELRGPSGTATVRVSCRKAGYRAERQAIVPKGADIMLRLIPDLTIEGGCILPPGVYGQSVIVAVRDRVTGRRSGAYLSAQRTPDVQRPRFSFKVAPGVYSIEVSLAGSNRPFMKLEGIRCPLDDASRAKLEAIDLRGRLRVWELEVVEADGRPLSSGHVTISGPPGVSRGAPVSAGRAVVVDPGTHVDIEAWSEFGGRASRRRLPPGRHRLVLAPRPKLSLRLSDEDAAIWRHVRIDAYLTSTSKAPGWQAPTGHAQLTAGETSELTVPVAADYDLNLQLTGYGPDGKLWSTRLKGSPGWIAVPAKGLSKPVVISIDEPEREARMKKMAGIK